MTPDELQEQAALWALGLLDDAEAAEFGRATEADPALDTLACELREAAAELAHAPEGGGEVARPPAALRGRVLAEVATGSGRRASPPRNPWATWVPWAVAAAAVALAGVEVLNRQWLMRERDGMYAAMIKAKMGRVDDTPLRQVALLTLEPTPEGSAQPRGAVAWDADHREGELVITQLQPPEGGHDYQLWALEEGREEPVSAGLVHVGSDGRATVAFKPTDDGRGKVRAIALSLEQAGGSTTNRGPILLLGKF